MYNIHTYPFIGIIDPQTGEKLTQFPTKMDPCAFCEKVTSFLCDHEAPYGEGEQGEEQQEDIIELDKSEDNKKAQDNKPV